MLPTPLLYQDICAQLCLWTTEYLHSMNRGLHRHICLTDVAYCNHVIIESPRHSRPAARDLSQILLA